MRPLERLLSTKETKKMGRGPRGIEGREKTLDRKECQGSYVKHETRDSQRNYAKEAQDPPMISFSYYLHSRRHSKSTFFSLRCPSNNGHSSSQWIRTNVDGEYNRSLVNILFKPAFNEMVLVSLEGHKLNCAVRLNLRLPICY